MGLFKSMKELRDLSKTGKQLQEQQKAEQGYSKGMGGTLKQMGDMIGQANQQLQELTDQSGERARILAEGNAAEATIIGMGTPERGAQWFNLSIDLEVHPRIGEPYRVANQYLVPHWAQLAPGVRLPVKVAPDERAKIAIDWDNAPRGPVEGEVRPAG